jgi:predicted ATP-grasp superfamily ATP-dependent carboligase
MINFIVVGKSHAVVVAVLQSIRSFTDAKTIVIGDEETCGLRWSNLCERQEKISFLGDGDGEFVTLVNRLVSQTPHVRLIPADCEGIRLTNRVRARLQVRITPIPDAATLDTFDDKWRFHQFCVMHNLSVPETLFVGSKFDFDYDAIVSRLGVPFLIKPTNQAGSLGVRIIRSRAYFDEAIRGNNKYWYSPLIAQRYIEGMDIDLSLLALEGKLSAFAIQKVSGSEVHFLPNIYLEEVAEKLCLASAYHGVMHVDARIERQTGKVFLIESNPRFWVSVTASVWCGLNFVAESIEPTPRPNGVRVLTSGTSYTRHPVIRPSSWWQLIRGSCERGRMLRSMTFDLYMLRNFVQQLPEMLWAYATSRTVARVKRFSQRKA